MDGVNSIAIDWLTEPSGFWVLACDKGIWEPSRQSFRTISASGLKIGKALRKLDHVHCESVLPDYLRRSALTSKDLSKRRHA
jgi:hypothetical protein